MSQDLDDDTENSEYYAIYLYYIRFEQSRQSPTCTTVHYDFGVFTEQEPDIVTKVKTLAGAIYHDPLVHHTCCGTRFSDIVRRRKGHLAFMVESMDGFRLYDVKMKDKKYLIGYEESTHTFEPANVVDATVETGKTVPVAYFFNHMKTRDRDDKSENYRFSLKFRRNSGARDEYNEFNDSGGTNTGPPIPPPSRRY